MVLDREAWRPTEDRAVIEALAKGDSMGVFYIESPAMWQLQKKSGAGDFEHIVIHSSIIRPAANTFINEYVRRLKGGAWEPLHPRLAYILDETYGILCYQEDVSKTAAALAGFDEAEADTLRKVIAKKAGNAKLGGL
jgi:DNA polymerase-3 subunit alpha/error-prone DNA polymerase